MWVLYGELKAFRSLAKKSQVYKRWGPGGEGGEVPNGELRKTRSLTKTEIKSWVADLGEVISVTSCLTHPGISVAPTFPVSHSSPL